jgi:glucoamylase
MKLISLFCALPATLTLFGAQCTPVDYDASLQTSIDAFVDSQTDVAIRGVLANIGNDGLNAQGAAAGVVIASPSRSDPDCKPPYGYIKSSSKVMFNRLLHVDSGLRFSV